MKAAHYKDLLVWQKAHRVVLLLYKATENFPKTEVYGLTNQMRRAAVSVTSNIAEGFARISNKEKVQFYYISLGSLSELDSQITIAHDLTYLSTADCAILEATIAEVNKMLHALIKSIAG